MKTDTILFILQEIAKELQKADIERQLYLLERKEINLKKLNDMENKDSGKIWKNNIQLLPKQFPGKGEVSNNQFKQVYSSEFAYIYKVTGANVYFEVFERKNSPVCIDFENRIYSEIEFKEIYPRAKAFGVWAWTFPNFKSAMKRSTEIKLKCLGE